MNTFFKVTSRPADPETKDDLHTVSTELLPSAGWTL